MGNRKVWARSRDPYTNSLFEFVCAIGFDLWRTAKTLFGLVCSLASELESSHADEVSAMRKTHADELAKQQAEAAAKNAAAEKSAKMKRREARKERRLRELALYKAEEKDRVQQMKLWWRYRTGELDTNKFVDLQTQKGSQETFKSTQNEPTRGPERSQGNLRLQNDVLCCKKNCFRLGHLAST